MSRKTLEERRKTLVEELLKCIESDPAPWGKGWYTMTSFPQNAKSGKAYKGLNAFYLAAIGAREGYSDPRWATFNQAKELGASVKAGEKASTIFFWSWYDKATKRPFDRDVVDGMTQEERDAYINENVRPMVQYYQVFNAEQCTDFPERAPLPVMSKEERERKNKIIERIISNSEAELRFGGDRAFYSVLSDSTTLPEIMRFKSMEDFYATSLHEMSHSTGHPSRLDRDLLHPFGSPEYAKEELRAELACIFLQIDLGISIDGKHFENHSAYLASWLQALQRDPKEFFAAASDAEKISNYIVEHYAKNEAMQERNLVREEMEREEKGLAKGGERYEQVMRADYPKEFADEDPFTAALLDDIEAASASKKADAGSMAPKPQGRRLSKDNARRLDEISRNVPQDMKAMPHWCVYRTKWNAEKGKKEKFILNPADGHWAKSSDASTWTSFEAALGYARRNNCEGLAFALTQASGITCIDLDKCYDGEGKQSELAKRMTELFPGTYTERSASGNGLHIFLRGDLTENGAYRNRAETPQGEIEAYSQARFISMTGDSVNRENVLAAPAAEAVREVQALLGARPAPTRFESQPSRYAMSNDAEVLERIRRSRRAQEYEALAGGENVTGDRSRNDWQMAKILAFFTAGDTQQVARIMRSSGINRPDKPDAYYERTAQKAVDALTSRYGDGIEQGTARESKVCTNGSFGRGNV